MTTVDAGTANLLRPEAALILAFTNSIDTEEQTDDITTPAELHTWLRAHDLVVGRCPKPSPADVAVARELRHALRNSLRGHHDGTWQAEALDRLAPQFPLILDAGGDPPRLRPAQDGVRGALSHLLIAVTQATASDTWRRLKICAADDCQWAFLDASKNRSRTWCEWGCGNKLKTKRYRARQRDRTAIPRR